MENIQNMLEVVIAPKKTNIYKILFFVCLLIIIGQIVCIYSILNKYKTKQIAPIQNSSTELKAYTKSDYQKIYLILNQDGAETIIDYIDKNEPNITDQIGFNNIRFSNSLKFLIYNKDYLTSFYNTETNLFIKNYEINYFTKDAFITNDEKYLIFCQRSEYGGYNGGEILNTSDSSVKFDFTKYLGSKVSNGNLIRCAEKNGKVVFYYNDDQEVTYDLTASEVK